MGDYIGRHNFSNIIRLSAVKPSNSNITDEELCFIDKMLDNKVLTGLLANDGYKHAVINIYNLSAYDFKLNDT